MKPLNDVDYVELYALKLREDNRFFRQQKIIIESQMKSSKEIFRRKFGSGKRFRINARAYLKKLEKS